MICPGCGLTAGYDCTCPWFLELLEELRQEELEFMRRAADQAHTEGDE